jgi:deazaflavin-dependent oxidoreductase (nitroreductase family)
MTTTPLRDPQAARRPVLGLRHKPGRLALAVFRLPLRAYRHDAGHLLGHTFLAFTHVGRRTGQPHDAVAMVLGYDEATREAVICVGWGPETDWYRNLQAGPARRVQIGRDAFVPQHRFLGEEEAFEVARRFRAAHPHRMRLICSILGWGDLTDDDALRTFVAEHPFVGFRPA